MRPFGSASQWSGWRARVTCPLTCTPGSGFRSTRYAIRSCSTSYGPLEKRRGRSGNRPHFLARQKGFVTGHTGFKGSWLCLWLLRLGADVYGYALPPATDPSLFTAARLARHVVSIEGDIRDADRLRAAIATHAPEIVFHLAAQALVVESYKRPLQTYATNVLGTAHLLEALRDSSCARVGVIVTSDKCYALGNNGERHAESDPLGGSDPYSSSKACAEFVTAAYRSAFFAAPSKDVHSQPALRTTIASARAGNIIGGGDWSAHRLIPDAVAALLAGKQLRLRNPRAVRPWQYVLDPLHGYLMLAEHLW